MRWIWIGLLVSLGACAPGTQTATKPVSRPSVKLSATAAARGTQVTATLAGIAATKTRVFVAATEVPSTPLSQQKLVFVVPYGAPGGPQTVQLKGQLGQAQTDLEISGEISGETLGEISERVPDAPAGLFFTPARAARGEVVTASVKVNAAEARVFVAGREAETTRQKPTQQKPTQQGETLAFKVPDDTPGGPQDVLVVTPQGENRGTLGVLGEVVPGEVIAIFRPSLTRAELGRQLEQLNKTLGSAYRLKKEGLERGYTDLGGREGPCAGNLAEITVGDRPLGQALTELKELGDLITWGPDPTGISRTGTADPIAAIRAGAFGPLELSGQGSVIAVLDTGVSKHEYLDDRLLPGFNFAGGNVNAADTYDDPSLPLQLDGHGTPVAVLAAGSKFGVAPGAQILPVRVCDGGECLVGDVIQGLCFALGRTESGHLILNLSLGGDTPVSIVEALLKFALGRGVPVVAAGGNDGDRGSPLHYPAAYDLPGLIAVGALEQTSEAQNAPFVPASFGTRGPYLDLAAPGVNLLSGTPDASTPLQKGYAGTSFATPLVAGAVAVLREAVPGLSPEAIEACLKKTAQPLSAPPEAVGAGMLDVAAALRRVHRSFYSSCWPNRKRV